MLGLLAWQLLAAAALSGFKEPIIQTVFFWVPEWAVRPLPADIAATASQTVVIITAASLLLLNGLLLPLGEELYFRGYLLPRITRFGAWAPLLNVALFSLYLFWTPWDLGLRIVLLLPMVYAMWRTQDLRIAILAHCGINTLGFVLNSGPTLLAG